MWHDRRDRSPFKQINDEVMQQSRECRGHARRLDREHLRLIPLRSRLTLELSGLFAQRFGFHAQNVLFGDTQTDS